MLIIFVALNEYSTLVKIIDSTLHPTINIMLLTLCSLRRWAVRQGGVMQHNADTSIILLQITPGFVNDSQHATTLFIVCTTQMRRAAA
jgi:hypothetical protein